MAPTMKQCPECGAELYAFQMPRHLFTEHAIGDPPKTRGASKKSSGGGSAESRLATGAAEPPPSSVEPPATEPEERAPGTEETPPRKPKLLDRFRSRRGRGHGGSAASASAERAPKRPKPSQRGRVALDDDISDIWAFAGRRLENTAHFATGRMLAYQAPAAGLILDRAVKGTLPDRILFQPIARNRDKYEDVGFLLAGPLLTFTITATGQQMLEAQERGDREAFADLANKLQMQREMFVWVARAMLPRLAEGVAKARIKKEKEDAEIRDAFPELAMGEDPVEALAAMLFTPPQGFEEASQNGKPDQAPAGAHREEPVPFGG